MITEKQERTARILAEAAAKWHWEMINKSWDRCCNNIPKRIIEEIENLKFCAYEISP